MTVALASPSRLRDGEVTLLPVGGGVAALLVAASHDEEIVRWTQVPPDMSLMDAGLVAAGWASSRRSIRMQVCVPQLTPVGMVTLWVNEGGDAEVGYWLLREARGQGVARCAVRLLCDWSFAACEIERIQLTTLPGNVASERVAVACGFRETGTTGRSVQGEPRTLRLFERGRSHSSAAGSLREDI